MGQSMNMMPVLGALLIILGVAGLTVPVFTTQETRDVVRVGDLAVQAQQDTRHTIPTVVSGTLLALGVVLVGGGLYNRSRSSS